MKPNKFLQNRSGIYGIRNIENNKLYVGRTNCMYKRCHQYVYDLKNRSLGHINDYLYNAIQKAGIDNFEFFPIEFSDVEVLEERELFWMIYYRTCERNFGYNLRQDVGKVYVVHPETSLKISNNLKKQWADGIRSEHGDKLKESWKTRDREAQSKMFSQIKTKYIYEITSNNITQTCNYSKLKQLGLENAIANFHRNKTNECTHKGFFIKRFNKGEQNDEN